MSNTYSATLVTAALEKTATTVLQNQFAPLAAFTRDFSADEYKPLATGTLKKVTAGSSTQTNASNFESGDSTVAAVQVTMNQYTQSFQVSNSDLNSGLRLADLIEINAKIFAGAILDVPFALITEANFGAATVISAPASFGFGDLGLLMGALKLSDVKNLVLDGDYFSQIANQPGFFQAVSAGPGGMKPFGWDAVHPCTRWSAADANIRGFGCNPQALGMVTGLPVAEGQPGGTLSRKIIVLPGLELPVVVHTWFSLSTRTLWCSFDLMLGAAVLDPSALKLIKSA